MGAIADAVHSYARPLLDSTDGSLEQVEQAMAIAQVCWNLALLPEEERNEFLAKTQPILKMSDRELEDFQLGVIAPMIQRHHQMFPRMHQRTLERTASPTPGSASAPAPRGKYPGTGRNAPCPCNSGLKYKRCCGRA